jgi:hypothetical protein
MFKSKLDIQFDNFQKTHRNANLETINVISDSIPALPPANVIFWWVQKL